MKAWLVFAGVGLALAALPAFAGDSLLKVSKSDCARLVRHNPSADVAYKPGEGVGGRKVAPADLPGGSGDLGQSLVPEVLEIPLSIMPMSGKGYAAYGVGDSQTQIGTIKYDMAKGTFTLNGKPLGSTEQQDLANACAKRGIK